MRKIKRFVGVLLLPLIVFYSSAGCATILASKKKTMEFNSAPVGAEIWVNGNRVGTTPYQMELENGKDYTITYRMEGHKELTCIVGNSVGAGWVILDILLGVVPVIVDAVTGDWNSLQQNSCNLTLEPVSP
jgi:hypothetical protein